MLIMPCTMCIKEREKMNVKGLRSEQIQFFWIYAAKFFTLAHSQFFPINEKKIQFFKGHVLFFSTTNNITEALILGLLINMILQELIRRKWLWQWLLLLPSHPSVSRVIFVFPNKGRMFCKNRLTFSKSLYKISRFLHNKTQTTFLSK